VIPATIGDDIDVPSATACVGSTSSHAGSTLPVFLSGGQSPVKMLFGEPGSASWLSAAMTTAPGARMSGFGTPVSVGPALENVHTSPSCASWRGAFCGRPPYESSSASVTPIFCPALDVHVGRSMEQPTLMMLGLVAGSVTVASRTARSWPSSSEKYGGVEELAASPSDSR